MNLLTQLFPICRGMEWSEAQPAPWGLAPISGLHRSLASYRAVSFARGKMCTSAGINAAWVPNICAAFVSWEHGLGKVNKLWSACSSQHLLLQRLQNAPGSLTPAKSEQALHWGLKWLIHIETSLYWNLFEVGGSAGELQQDWPWQSEGTIANG